MGMSKTGRYTNVVCSWLKILHSAQNPGPSVARNSFWGERTAFILSFLFLFFPRPLLLSPLSWG